ncbi:MAG: peptide deformylase [Isosphaerales bacterium]
MKGFRHDVPRHLRIRVHYQMVDGRIVDRNFAGFIARVFQHEDDHLRGLVFFDRLESSRDVITEKEYQKRVASMSRTAQKLAPVERMGVKSEPSALSQLDFRVSDRWLSLRESCVSFAERKATVTGNPNS